MRTKFVVDLSLHRVFSDACERAALLVPLWHTLKVYACVVIAAFALHVRIVWHTVQIVCFFALLVAAVALRRDVPRRRYYDRKALSTYERTHIVDLEVRWHLTLVAYAAWIAYGALAHDGRHATADAALVEGVLYVPKEIGSTAVVSTARFVALLALFYLSGSYKSYMLVFDGKRANMLAALGAWFLLLSLPPQSGVPQSLGVAASVMRYAAFALLFVATEMWRMAVQHYAFVARVCSDTLSDTDLAAMNANSLDDVDAKRTFVVSSSATNAAPRDVLAIEESPLGLAWFGLLRSAWVLSAPSSVATYVATFVCIVCTLVHTKEWTRRTRARALHRLRAQQTSKKTQAAAAAAAATPTTTTQAANKKRILLNANETPLERAQRDAAALKQAQSRPPLNTSAKLNASNGNVKKKKKDDLEVFFESLKIDYENMSSADSDDSLGV